MEKKIKYFLFLFLINYKISKADFIFSFNFGIGLDKFSMGGFLPMNSFICRISDKYFANVMGGTVPINFLSDEVKYGNIYSSIFEKEINPKNKLLLKELLNKLEIRGYGIYIPIDFRIEYEFFESIRFGIGVNFGINYFNKLKLSVSRLSPEEINSLILKNKDNLLDVIKLYRRNNDRNFSMLKDDISKINRDYVVCLDTLINNLDEQKDKEIKEDLKKIVSELKKNNEFAGEKYFKDYYSNSINEIELRNKLSFILSPYFVFGIKIFSSNYWNFLIEYKLYPITFRFKNFFYPDFISPTVYFRQGIGIFVEYFVSEYFSTTYKFSFDCSSFSVSEKRRLPSFFIETFRFYFEFGTSFRITEIERCHIKYCNIDRKHSHSGKLVRGKNLFCGRDNAGYRMF